MKIAIGSDHAGFGLKNKLTKHLLDNNYEVKDFGTYSEESCDYPDYAHAVANAVESKEYELGLLMCGSGNGINITANKHQGVRSALAWTSEIAELAKLHNDANILTLPARFISEEEALSILKAFLNAVFEGGRHQNRVNKIAI